MDKKLFGYCIIILTLLGNSAFCQTISTWPTGGKLYGNPIAMPDGSILLGRTGSYTYMAPKKYVDSLMSLGAPASWDNITGKPSTFPPSAHTHSASDITSGTLAIGRIPVGTGSGTVAAGNDSRIANAVPNTRTVTTGSHLTGGGALSSNQTFGFAPSSNVWITDNQSNMRMYFSHDAPQNDVVVRLSQPSGVFVVRNSSNSGVWTINSSGTLAFGSVPWARLTDVPNIAVTSANNNFTGSNSFSQPVTATQYQGTSTTASSSIPTDAQTIFTASRSTSGSYTLTNLSGNPRHIQVVIANTSGSDINITFNANFPADQDGSVLAGTTAIFTFLIDSGTAWGTKTQY